MSIGSNSTGLRRWNWVQLKSQNSSIYIITAYQCVKSKSIVGTVFMQRERHLKRCNISRFQRQHFITDIVNFITSLQDRDNRIILAVDINEHAVDRKLVKELKRIGMIDAYFKKFNSPGPASYVMGSVPIDRVWVTGNVIPLVVSIFS